MAFMNLKMLVSIAYEPADHSNRRQDCAMQVLICDTRYDNNLVMATAFPSIKLNSGYDCPLLGLGTWQTIDYDSLKTALKAAFKAGYRHLDTAQLYANEHLIGQALQELYQEGIVERKDIFITTKLWPTNFAPEMVEKCIREQLQKLKTDYVDLYLLHFPVPFKPPSDPSDIREIVDGQVLFGESKLEESWAALENCQQLGLVRSIGVSNSNINQVKRLLKSSIKPAMNQIELHPGCQFPQLVVFCQQNGVAVTGYSSFGSPGSTFFGKQYIGDKNYLQHPALVEIGRKYGKCATHVILRWLVQRNIVAIPKSSNPARIEDNAKIWDFQLSEEDLATIEAMDENKHYCWALHAYPGLDKHPEYPYTEMGSVCANV